ncbi:MAG: OmpH family outer membrane protein [Rhodospirillales bacterium]|nr:OmpH family outer membrane protein [Rhodospirillales bacterium]
MIVRRFFVVAVVLAGLVAPALPVRAQEMPTVRLGILDVGRALQNASAVKGIRSQLSTYMDSYRADTQKEEQSLRSGQEELVRKRAVLSADAFAAERQKLEQRLAAAQAKVQDRRQSLERVHAEAMQKVQDVLANIVNTLASERGLTLILRKDQTVYSAASYEITDEVLKRLDKQLPSVKIGNPNTPAKK